MTTFEYLQYLLDEHRKKAFVCCDEKCFCWDIEKMLSTFKEAGGITKRAGEPDTCPACFGFGTDITYRKFENCTFCKGTGKI